MSQERVYEKLSLKPVTGEERDYIDLIKTFNFEIITEAHDNDYQGDSFYLLYGKNQYGFLVFGWGSCSGCDAFEAAMVSGNRVQELQELRDSLYHSVYWFQDLDELGNWIISDDRELSFFGRHDAFKEIRGYVVSKLDKI